MAEHDISGSVPRPGNAAIRLPVVDRYAPKQTILIQGSESDGPSHWATDAFKVPDAVSLPSAELQSTSGAPSAYEARRDALMAASTYCNGGGYGGSKSVIEIAREFEKFLKEAT